MFRLLYMFHGRQVGIIFSLTLRTGPLSIPPLFKWGFILWIYHKRISACPISKPWHLCINAVAAICFLMGMRHRAGPECETISEHLPEVTLANYTEGLQHTVFSWESQHGLLGSSSSATLSCFWGTLRRQWTCPEQVSRVDLSEASLSDNWTTSFGNSVRARPPGVWAPQPISKCCAKLFSRWTLHVCDLVLTVTWQSTWTLVDR